MGLACPSLSHIHEFSEALSLLATISIVEGSNLVSRFSGSHLRDPKRGYDENRANVLTAPLTRSGGLFIQEDSHAFHRS
jgi:hypothetical protein